MRWRVQSWRVFGKRMRWVRNIYIYIYTYIDTFVFMTFFMLIICVLKQILYNFTPHSYRQMPGLLVLGCWLRFETVLFQEMRAPLARNNTVFQKKVCPSCTKPHFFKKCVPLLHETILFCQNTEIRTRGYVNNSRNLPTSRTQRTQGRNIPVQGNPSLRYRKGPPM